jgi:cholesterol transport system auxiliary component
MTKMRKPLIFCIFLFLAGCSLPPRNTGTADMFALLPVMGAAPAKPAPGRLGVAFPVTSPELDTARIALRRADGDWDYYAGARWADFLPVMVQDNIVKSIENTRIFASVTPDAGPSSDRVLKIEIRDFEADYRRAAAVPLVRVRLAFTLLDHRRTQALAHFEAESTARAARDSLPAAQAAFQKAFSEAEKQGISALAAKAE